MGGMETRIDRILGFGGIALVVVVVALVIADLGDLDWLEAVAWVLGVIMLAWMVAITLRHFRVYDSGGGRDLLTAGWVSIPVIAGLVVLGGLAAGRNPLDDWIVELPKSSKLQTISTWSAEGPHERRLVSSATWRPSQNTKWTSSVFSTGPSPSVQVGHTETSTSTN